MERSTFVIDADGNVTSIMRKVKPADHADDVLAALPERKLAGAAVRDRDGGVPSTTPGD